MAKLRKGTVPPEGDSPRSRRDSGRVSRDALRDELQKENEALRKSNLELRAIVERNQALHQHAPFGCLTLDAEGRVVEANEMAATLIGLPEAELIGCEVTAFLDGDDAEAVHAHRRDALRGRKPSGVRVHVRRADGSRTPVQIESVVVHGGDAEPAWRVVLFDLTEVQSMRDELRRAHKMEIVGAMASGLAHDLGNVLQAVIGCAQVASDERTPAESAREHMRRVGAAANRGSRLVRRLMAFSRSRALDRRPMSVAAALEGAADILPHLVTKHIHLDLRIDVGDAYVIADPSDVEQIILNLGANARDAMPDGGTFRIVAECVVLDPDQAKARGLASGGDYVRLVVQDTGIGMDSATQSRIFDRFFTTKGAHHGTGLGLATVLSLTQSLKGSIEVASTLGRGTTFTFHFPMCERVPSDSVLPLPTLPTFAGAALVVEDEATVRSSLRRCLEDLGFEVLEANDLADALDLCERRHGRLDVVVADTMMRELPGPRLLDLLGPFYPGLRALFVSAYPRAILIDYGVLAPDAPFLQKPFGREQLAARLASLLHGTDAVMQSAPEPEHEGPRAISVPDDE